MPTTSPSFRVGASIWGFFNGQPRSSWPSIAEAVDSILSLDAELGVEVWASRELAEPGAMGFELQSLTEAASRAEFVSVHVRGLFWRWDPAKLRDEIDFAQRVGARTLVLHPVCFGLRRPGDPFDVDEVRRIADYGRDRNVQLSMENVRDSIWVLDRLLEEIGPDPEATNLGICIDVGHAHLSRDIEEDRVCGYLDRYADALVHLHLHDNRGERDEHLALGEGTVDWAGVIDTLRSNRFSGTAVLEIHGSEEPTLPAIERSVATLCELVGGAD